MNPYLFILLLLFAACGFEGAGPPAPPDEDASAGETGPGPGFRDPYFGIVYPERGMSIGFAETECLIRIPPGKPAEGGYRVFWNDRDVTARFRPFVPRPSWKKGGWRLAAGLDLLHSGRIGDNRLEIREEIGGRWQGVDSVDFRFDPHPLRLDFSIRDRGGPAAGNLLPARLTFRGVGGTPTPNFLHETSAQHNAFQRTPFVLSVSGTGSVLVPEGDYEVLVSRGPEYTAARTVLGGRGTRRKEFLLQRVVDTSGYLSADFHAHSIVSDDSHVSLALRAASFAAAGVEFLALTDHDALTDLAPVLRRHGLAARLGTAVGTEVALNAEGISGHWNVLPWEVSENETRIPDLHPAIARLRAAEPFALFDWARRVERLGAQENPFAADAFRGWELPLPEEGRLIQLNHPRGIQLKPEDWPFGYFQEIGFDPDCGSGGEERGAGPACQAALFRRSEGTGTSNLDFELIELYNRTSLELYRRVRSDWFWLLNRGIFKVGTANTDTHSPLAGYPRNFVKVGAGRDRPGRIGPQEVFAALRGGGNLGSTGPFIHLSAAEAGGDRPEVFLGGRLDCPSRRVRLRLRVEAAPWVPVEEVRIYLNGEVTERFDGGTDPRLSSPTDPFGAGPVIRLETEVGLTVAGDSWIVVEAGGREDGRRETGDPVLSAYRSITGIESPVAFTNPIFVDVDGNGEFDPGPPGSPGTTATE